MRILILIFCLAIQPLAANAQDRAKVERQFQNWLQETVWPQARAKGVSRQTMTQALSGVTLKWDLPDLVPPGSPPRSSKPQSQAEFGAPARYFKAGSLQGATAQGRKMAKQHAAVLTRVEAETGVPAHIILAIWGRESGYGQVAIPHNAFQVLATKGFMSTRSQYFTAELLAALQIAEAGHLNGREMKSSWAGALGQPQFMPSSFLTYAVDGDGDSSADIWQSEEDTIASIANYLSQHGWISGRDWGFEVVVPDTVSCALEGPDQGRAIEEWASMGITRTSGRPFPAHELPAQGFLMMPAGQTGPAFLVTQNFYVLKDYNKSDLYALFVGHVGDRIAFGVGDFTARWGEVDPLYRSEIAAMQRGLERLGHDVGGADGLPGFKTRRSIGRWQKTQDRAETCFPDRALVSELGQ